jgi:nitrogen fixation/metabolism regulation signal transduction histidine kinase
MRIFRKQYFIDKEFQGKFVVRNVIISVTLLLVFSFLLNYFSEDSISILYENYKINIGGTSNVLFDRFLSAQWLTFLLGGIVIVIYSIVVSHKIAGPMYRFGKTMDEMIRGNLTSSVKLRKSDECIELGDKMNHYNAELRGKTTEISQLLDEIESDPDKKDEIRKILKSINREL